MLTRSEARIGALALAAALAAPVAADAAAPATPAAVRKAAVSVVLVRSNNNQGSAVRIGPESSYLTATTLVARTSEIAVSGADKRPGSAQRVLSDAPSGTVLLRRSGTDSTGALVPAGRHPATGATVYVISRDLKTSEAHIVRTSVRASTKSNLVLETKTFPGRNGGAVVDTGGRLLGITVPPVPGAGGSRHQRSIVVDAAPVVQRAGTTTSTAGFPAIPVTVGLGVLLLLVQLILLRRRKVALGRGTSPIPPERTAPAPAPAVEAAAETPVASPAPPAAPASFPAAGTAVGGAIGGPVGEPAAMPEPVAAASAPADEFEITLRPRG